MKWKFKAKIYKVGINPCVQVPVAITDKMKAIKGYIYIKGKIEDHPFQQTLVPIKNSNYRLYVNGPMMKGGHVKPGDTVHFVIEPDSPNARDVPMQKALRDALTENALTGAFKALTPSRQKEILKYLSFLKTKESLDRNVQKIINGLNGTEVSLLFPKK